MLPGEKCCRCPGLQGDLLSQDAKALLALYVPGGNATPRWLNQPAGIVNNLTANLPWWQSMRKSRGRQLAVPARRYSGDARLGGRSAAELRRAGTTSTTSSWTAHRCLVNGGRSGHGHHGHHQHTAASRPTSSTSAAAHRAKQVAASVPNHSCKMRTSGASCETFSAASWTQCGLQKASWRHRENRHASPAGGPARRK